MGERVNRALGWILSDGVFGRGLIRSGGLGGEAKLAALGGPIGG